jgi:hypothetical protein
VIADTDIFPSAEFIAEIGGREKIDIRLPGPDHRILSHRSIYSPDTLIIQAGKLYGSAGLKADLFLEIPEIKTQPVGNEFIFEIIGLLGIQAVVLFGAGIVAVRRPVGSARIIGIGVVEFQNDILENRFCIRGAQYIIAGPGILGRKKILLPDAVYTPVRMIERQGRERLPASLAVVN